MSMIWYDIKRSKRWILAWVVAAMLFFTVCVSVVAIWHKSSNPNRELLGDDGKPQIGLDLYASGTFQVFDCISKGDACPKFGSAKKSMSGMSETFTYTPLPGGKSPGNVNGNGTRTVDLRDLSDGQWRQVGQAVMRGGDVQMNSVLPEEMDVDQSEAQAQFTLPSNGSTVRGVVAFEHSGSAEAPDDVQVTSVTYSSGGG